MLKIVNERLAQVVTWSGERLVLKLKKVVARFSIAAVNERRGMLLVLKWYAVFRMAL